MSRTIKDLTGRRFGRLRVFNFFGVKEGQGVWDCWCDCGAMVTVTSNQLLCGRLKSCGCGHGRSAK